MTAFVIPPDCNTRYNIGVIQSGFKMAMGILRLITLASASIVFAAFANVAHAQSTPRAVEGYALSIEKSCVSAHRGDWSKLATKRNSHWLAVVAEDASDKVLLVQGNKTRCEPASQLICGTGGCPIGVFRVGKGGVKRLFAAQVLEWSRKSDGGKLAILLRVHGSHCGSFGADACASMLDLNTGKLRTFKPKQ